MKYHEKELMLLDPKDQRILAELFRNGRAPYSTIARNTGLSKDVVKYRMEQFVKKGLMRSVTTIIDIKKIGWNSAIVLFKLNNIDKLKIKNFTNYLVKSPFVVEVLEFAGNWDFAARFYYKDVSHLSNLLNEIGTSVIAFDPSVFFLSKNIVLPYNALFEKYKINRVRQKSGPCKVDDLDLRVLSSISADARKPLSAIEEELDEGRMTVYNRIKKMKKAGVIDSFRPDLYTEKLGFHWYSISLKLNDKSEEKIKKITDMLETTMRVHFIMTGFGASDIMFYAQVKTVQDLQEILYNLREEFSDNIKSVESANIIKDYKWDFFPNGFLESMKKNS